MKDYLQAGIQKIADIPFYTEGPAIDSSGLFYCTTLSGGKILQIDEHGHIVEWAESACPNGQIVMPNGDHLICDSKLGVIKRFDAKGRFLKDETKICFAGRQTICLNDLVADRKGNIFFTDSVRRKGAVLFLGNDGTERLIAEDLDYPNGLALSIDENHLYVAESYRNRILKIKLTGSELIAQPEVFARLPAHHSNKAEDNLPDGLTLDSEGNLYVAHYGMGRVQILSPSGDCVSSIEIPFPLASNLFFVGKNILYVTGGSAEPGPGAVVAVLFDRDN